MTKTGLDIVRPMSSERARAAYLESQIRNIDSVQLPSKVPSMEEEINLTRRINTFCKEQKEKRRQEWESHRKALAVLKQSKHKQLEKEEREVVYSQIAHDMEKTRNMV